MLIKHQAVKTYGPCCLGYGTIWWWVIRFTLQPLNLRKPVGNKLGGHQSQSRRCREYSISYPVRESISISSVVRLRTCSERTSKGAQETERLERGYCRSESHDPWKQTWGSLLELRLLPEQDSGRRYVVCFSAKIGRPAIGRHAV